MSQRVRSLDDLQRLLDELLERRAGPWWDGFYADRTRVCPFFVVKPDASLVAFLDSGRLAGGRALELGCGNGRNAVLMASRGLSVRGVDFSAEALGWAREQAESAGVSLELEQRDILELRVDPGAFELVYDSGCFHHIAPHRRPDYLRLVELALAPGGWLGLSCFTSEDGSGLSDLEVYERRTLGGGLGFSERELRELFMPRFEMLELRRMRKEPEDSPLFGQDFLWTVWMRRRPVA